MNTQKSAQGAYKPIITVDCANGIGAVEIREIGNKISNDLKLTLVNDGKPGILNHNVICAYFCMLF